MKVLNHAIGAALVLISFSAHADHIIKSAADWSLAETDAGVCYASTNNIDPNNDTWPQQGSTVYIQISKAKNKPNSPVELMLQFTSNQYQSTGAQAQLSGAGNINFSDMDGRKSNFWGVPKGLATFISKLQSNSANFKVKTLGGKRSEDLKLTTRGFSDILKEMQNYCNAGQPLVNADFENALFATAPDVDPTKIDPTKTQQLRGLYFAAYADAAGIAANKYALANILVKYQPLIDELKLNRDEVGNITNSLLPAQRTIVANAQKQQQDATNDINRINTEIPKLQEKIDASQKNYDAARAILAPLVPEHDRLSTNLQNAQSRLSSSQSRLVYIDTRLRDGQQQISNLEYEARNIEQRLPQKQNDLDRARSALRDAQSRRANFNVSWERDSRLRNNWEYQRLLQDRQSAQQQYNQANNDVQRARMDRDNWARQLQQCRTSPILTEDDSLTPNPIAPPPVGPTNPPPPPKDCSMYESGYQQADNDVRNAEMNQRNLANRINDDNNRIMQVERQVEMDVRREYDQLVYTEQSAQQTYDRINNDYNSDQNRLSQIRNADIPRLEREQTALTNERPTVLSNISQATTDVARYQRELDSFNSANDWDRKASAVDSTGNQLAVDQRSLSDAQANKAEAEGRLHAGAATEATAKTEIDRLNSRLGVLNARADELNRGLAKLPEERAQLDKDIAAGQAAFNIKKDQFLALLK